MEISIIKKKLHIHVIYVHGEDQKPFGVAYIRDLLPLTHPISQEVFEVTWGTVYIPADIVIVERMWKPDVSILLAEALVEEIRKDKAVFIYSIDDNLLDHETIPTETGMVIRLFCREADGILVTTNSLRDRLRLLNPNIFVIPNALDERLFSRETYPHHQNLEQKVMGFMGTFTHDADLMMILQPLRKILRTHSGELRIQLVGGFTDSAFIKAFKDLPLEIMRVPTEDVEYPRFVAWMKVNLRWDIALAPLEDNQFNRFKSDIKFLDYSALGIPGIYSKVQSYENTVQHLETGYLAEKTPDDWYDGLDYLLNDDDIRKKLATEAQEYVFSQRVLEQSVTQWHSAIFSILDNKTESATSGRIQVATTNNTLDLTQGGYIFDNGERVSHLYPNDCFYAHLSIYHFASEFCKDGIVLDAGSGSGYGSAYLAKKGAGFVCGIEIDKQAVAFSRQHFSKTNLEYKQMDLEEISGFPKNSFDLIFSSNVLEHIPDVIKFFYSAWELLKPNGALLVAVHPIVRKIDWLENIDNIYHLNIWTPRQWLNVISLFFKEVQCYWHGFNKPGTPLDFHNTPEQSRIDEKDFIFKAIPIDEFYTNPTLTVVLLARKHQPSQIVPPLHEPISYVENSFTRVLNKPIQM